MIVEVLFNADATRASYPMNVHLYIQTDRTGTLRWPLRTNQETGERSGHVLYKHSNTPKEDIRMDAETGET